MYEEIEAGDVERTRDVYRYESKTEVIISGRISFTISYFVDELALNMFLFVFSGFKYIYDY